MYGSCRLPRLGAVPYDDSEVEIDDFTDCCERLIEKPLSCLGAENCLMNFAPYLSCPSSIYRIGLIWKLNVSAHK